MRPPARLVAIVALTATPLLGLVPTADAAAGKARVIKGHDVAPVRVNGFEAGLAADLNQARRDAGLRPLVVVAGATDVARRWAWHLADAQQLSHNPSLIPDLEHAGSANWTMIAENVGEGPADDPDTLFHAYMASPEHRANILDHSARYLGVGTVERDGVAWNTLDFTDAYTNAYGLTRVPAAGLTMDRQPITRATDVASLNGVDQRFTADHRGGLAASRLAFRTAGNGSAYTWLRRTGRTGTGGVLMRDALDLSRASLLTVQVSARAANRARVPVHVLLRRDFGTTVDLGTVKVGGTAHSYSFTLPRSARSFRTALSLRVTAAAVKRAGGRVRLAVYDVRAAV